MSTETTFEHPEPTGEKQEFILNPNPPETPQTLFTFIASETGYILDKLDKGELEEKDEAFKFLNVISQEYLRHAFFGATILAGRQPPAGITAVPEAAFHAQTIFSLMREKHKEFPTLVERAAFAGSALPTTSEALRYRIYEFSQVLHEITAEKVDLTQYDPLDGRITRTLEFFRMAHELQDARQNPDGSEKMGNRFVTPQEAEWFNRILSGLHTNPDITKEEYLEDERKKVEEQNERKKVEWWEEQLSSVDLTPLEEVEEKEMKFLRTILQDVMVYPPVIAVEPTRAVMIHPNWESQQRSERMLERAGVIVDFSRRISTREEQAVEDLLAEVDITDDFSKRIPTPEEQLVENLLAEVDIPEDL